MERITPEEAEKNPGAMLLQDGHYYISKPNLYAYRYSSFSSSCSSPPPLDLTCRKALDSMKQSAEALRDTVRKIPEDLKCPLCQKLLRDAMQLTCCGASFCAECIHPDSGETSVHCPICKRLVVD